MRTYIYLFLVTSLTITNWAVHAQTSKFNLGVIGGPSYSFHYGNDYYSSDRYRLLYTVGLTAQANLTNKFSITTNLLLEQRGEKLKGIIYFGSQTPNGYQTGDAISTQNYITLPIMGTYNFGKNNRFSISMGPYISHLFLVKSELIFDGKTTTNRVTNLDKPIEAGWCFNIGTNIPLTDKLHLGISARNNLGLITHRQDFNTIQLLLGVSYHFKQ
ncbi:MAG: PorT family protein [Bacteroidetes bacterium]|nr:MAG: PorT family protein [Bacteroidota bacterium]